MKGRWAAGITPRNFAWVIRDTLAVSERPGGYARNHRRVRRQEEIVWLQVNGFTRVVSLLGSPHNLHAYDEVKLAWAHVPFGPCTEPRMVLPSLYGQLDTWVGDGERVLVHQEELGDRLMGAVAGYLIWARKLSSPAQAVTVVEQMLRRQMGPQGRALVALASELERPGSAAVPGPAERPLAGAPDLASELDLAERPLAGAPGSPAGQSAGDDVLLRELDEPG